MPGYKNYFAMPDHQDFVIKDENDKTVGTLRVKPSGLSWAPKGQHQFFSVSLDKFTEWITDPQTNAKRTKS